MRQHRLSLDIDIKYWTKELNDSPNETFMLVKSILAINISVLYGYMGKLVQRNAIFYLHALNMHMSILFNYQPLDVKQKRSSLTTIFYTTHLKVNPI